MLVHGIFHTRILEWVAIPSLEIFPTQGSNPGLVHCRQILNCLRHQGGPNVPWKGKGKGKLLSRV